MSRVYITVDHDLVPMADAICDWLEVAGYEIEIEPMKLGYPYRPTLRCRRQLRTLLVEIDKTANLERMKEWASYSRAQSSETLVAVAVPTGTIEDALVEALKVEGVGVYLRGDSNVTEMVVPRDQTVTPGLPALKRYNSAVRQELGGAYEKIRRGEWQDGFHDACQALERVARGHLIRRVESGRVVLTKKKGVVTASEIEKASMGLLGEFYGKIAAPTHADTVVGAALKAINHDRVTVVHYREDPKRVAQLKRDWQGHIWCIADALKQLL